MFNLNAAVWGAIAKACEKRFERVELADGARHEVRLDAVGTVDGVRFALDLDCVMTVGHGGMRASSVPVEPVRQLAYVLELIDLAYGPGAADGILADVRAKFLDSGTVPASECWVEVAEQLDKSLRVAKQVAYSGAVKVSCVDVPQLALEVLEVVG